MTATGYEPSTNGKMRVKSAPGSARSKSSHTDAVTAPIVRGPRLLDRAQVEAQVLGHEGVGEPGGVAPRQDVLGELVAGGRAPATRLVQHLEHRPHVEPGRATEGDRLAGGGQRRRRQEVVGQLQDLAHPGTVPHPVAAVAEPAEHRLDPRRPPPTRRTSRRACAPGPRRRRRTLARRRRRDRRPPVSPPRPGPTSSPIVDVSTTWVVRRPEAAARAPATSVEAGPSGRLSTTTSACRATAATSSA